MRFDTALVIGDELNNEFRGSNPMYLSSTPCNFNQLPPRARCGRCAATCTRTATPHSSTAVPTFYAHCQHRRVLGYSAGCFVANIVQGIVAGLLVAIGIDPCAARSCSEGYITETAGGSDKGRVRPLQAG